MAYDALKEKDIPVCHYQADDDAETSSIRISSLHSAKGHEYAAVFIIGMVEGSFPPKICIDDIPREKALLYVGMTRARDLLYLSYSEVSSNGRRQERSRFLDEISGSCDSLVAEYSSCTI
jgi:superfamily I DNA/RNA helicase